MADAPVVSVWLKPEFEPGLLSVVIPTYNRAALLLETLESVFKQDYRPLEVIVADDGSKDDTVGRVNAVAAQDGVQLRLITLSHAGAPAARNHGAAASRGEFVMFLDSDDVLHEGALTALHSGMANADFAFGQWREWFSNESPPRFGPVTTRTAAADLLVEFLHDRWLMQGAILYRRRTLAGCGGWDESLKVHEDFEFLLRVALGGAKAAGVERLVADYRQHSKLQVSRSGYQLKHSATETALQRAEAFLHEAGWTPQRRAALAWRWYWIGRMAWFQSRDVSALKHCMAEARRIDPAFKVPKVWYRWIAAVAGYVAAERFAGIARRVLGRR